MAAALPGMCAALFSLPVIGVPLSGSKLNGTDALYSTVQMPSGIPVATVAIDGTKNAAILAARILAVADPEMLSKIKEFGAKGKEAVIAKDARLQEVGYKNY
jgi:5-(carboxyamino)imidazole ribonucleotide mutase